MKSSTLNSLIKVENFLKFPVIVWRKLGTDVKLNKEQAKPTL